MNKELLSSIINGNEAAFVSLYEMFAPRLYNFSLQYMHDPLDAEDIVQETFVVLWETRDRINPDESIRSYLAVIAKNRIFNLIKRKFIQKKHQGIIAESFRANLSGGDELLWNDMVELMFNSMEQLPQRQKDILIMRSKGYNNAQISNMLGISLRTVEAHFSRGLANMREMIGPANAYMLFLLFGCLS